MAQETPQKASKQTDWPGKEVWNKHWVCKGGAPTEGLKADISAGGPLVHILLSFLKKPHTAPCGIQGPLQRKLKARVEMQNFWKF